MTILFSALDKLRLHGIYDILFLLTHGLTQGITLTTSEVGKLTAKKHHLLLIYRDTIGIFQIFLHTRNIVGNERWVVLTTNKLWNIVHRSWTIQSIHGDKVFEYRRVQIAKVLLHTRRLKLEGTNGASLLI